MPLNLRTPKLGEFQNPDTMFFLDSPEGQAHITVVTLRAYDCDVKVHEVVSGLPGRSKGDVIPQVSTDLIKAVE